MEASDWNETSELKYLTHWMPLPSPPDDVAAPAEQQAAPKAAPGEKEETKAERFRRLLDYDTKTGVFTWKSARGGLPANSEAGYVHTDKYGNKYRCIKIDGKIYQVQRVVFMHCFGLDLGKFEVDHIDGDTFNNAISNLRIVTHKQNSENRRLGANNKSGYMGVSWSKKDQTWIASIKHHGKSIFLGHFANAESAHEAYEEKRAELFTHDEGRHLPQPAPAPLSEMPYEKRKAIQEGEQIGASDAWFKARHEMLDTVDRRNVFRAGFDRGWNAALAAQGVKCPVRSEP